MPCLGPSLALFLSIQLGFPQLGVNAGSDIVCEEGGIEAGGVWLLAVYACFRWGP